MEHRERRVEEEGERGKEREKREWSTERRVEEVEGF